MPEERKLVTILFTDSCSSTSMERPVPKLFSSSLRRWDLLMVFYVLMVVASLPGSVLGGRR